jgi:hypothetical protein
MPDPTFSTPSRAGEPYRRTPLKKTGRALPPALEAASNMREFAPGDVVFRQGESATAIYKVEDGSCA